MENNIYYKVYKWENLVLAWRKARKGKTNRYYILEFEENLLKNLQQLQFELMTLTYEPKPLKTFILRDPKTRKISKSDFRDRVIHHALINVIQPIFEKSFIYDSCANQIGKGNLFALKRFDKFKRKVTNNLNSGAFCFKADIKHYFEEVNHSILLKLIERKITDKNVLSLIKIILGNGGKNGKGMPLGNLTSQFFANIYLNELDYFFKHQLIARYYIRYVDDFVVLHNSKRQLGIWKAQIVEFLREKLRLELHPQKSRIILLSEGVDFVGFRNFYFHRLLRKRNISNILIKINLYQRDKFNLEELLESFKGWCAYAKWANSYNLINNFNLCLSER